MGELQQQLEDETQVAALAKRYTASETFRREFDTRVAQVLRAVDAPPEVALSALAVETGTLDRGWDIIALAGTALRQVAQAKIKETHDFFGLPELLANDALARQAPARDIRARHPHPADRFPTRVLLRWPPRGESTGDRRRPHPRSASRTGPCRA